MPNSADDVFSRSLRPFLYERGSDGPPISFVRPAHTARGWRLNAPAGDSDAPLVRPFFDSRDSMHAATPNCSPGDKRLQQSMQRYILRISSERGSLSGLADQTMNSSGTTPEVSMAMTCTAAVPRWGEGLDEIDDFGCLVPRRDVNGKRRSERTRKATKIAPIVPWRQAPVAQANQGRTGKPRLSKASLSAPNMLELVASTCGKGR
eukprot:TRINITY_DN9717_c1_g1_i1.p1 TRINITY_DN9717_c1_g1~~TRINITY_DN9717_c1_g1_i1.p1  ORF type:complete len:231 (-),score=25.95 TRINITY_DN9717_c1_g1_i1:436-1053(-)